MFYGTKTGNKLTLTVYLQMFRPKVHPNIDNSSNIVGTSPNLSVSWVDPLVNHSYNYSWDNLNSWDGT